MRPLVVSQDLFLSHLSIDFRSIISIMSVKSKPTNDDGGETTMALAQDEDDLQLVIAQ